MSATRLSPDSWIQAGFDALFAQGPSALKAEALARELKTTKGSFYWHFKDVPAYHEALLQTWETTCLARFNAIKSSHGTAVQRLRLLAQILENDGTSDTSIKIEPAMRSWAQENQKVAASVSQVDSTRLKALDELLAEIGLSNPELSRIIYAANLGMVELSKHDGQENAEALGTLVDLILALYD